MGRHLITMKAPFPYFGGKGKIAATVWRALGNVSCFVEPFCGSAAVLLARPGLSGNGTRREVINDYDCNVANFWRSVKWRPDETAEWAAWPTSHVDLYARRKYLLAHQDELRLKLAEDMDYCDPKMAGLWAWGQSSWVGGQLMSARCLEDGRFGAVPEIHHPVGIRRLAHHPNAPGMPISVSCEEEARKLIRMLSDRLAEVCVLNNDWRQALGGYLNCFGDNAAVGLFMDPPYEFYARDKRCYRVDSVGISADVREWCARNGSNPGYRIVLCGYGDEHDSLLDAGWRKRAWSARAGWTNLSGETANSNRTLERLWLSPECLEISGDDRPESRELMLAFGGDD